MLYNYNESIKPIYRFTLAEFITSLNVAVLIAGYPFVASLLKPLGYVDSQSVTIPFRIFVLAISSLSFFIGIYKGQLVEWTSQLKLLYILFAFYILKTFVSIVACTVPLPPNETIRIWGMIITTFISGLSVIYTYRIIRYDMAFLMTFLMLLFVSSLRPLGIGSSTVDLMIDSTYLRQDASVALNTISYGMVGSLLSILALYLINKGRVIWKLFSLAIIPLGCYTISVAGSKTPVVMFAVVFLIYVASLFNIMFVTILMLPVLLFFIYFFRYQLIDWLSYFSPLLGRRFWAMLEEDSFSGRDELFKYGFQEFLDNPIFGGSIMNHIESVGLTITPIRAYHSSIIDSLAIFGVFGLIYIWLMFIVAKDCFKMFSYSRVIPNFWLVMFAFGSIITNAIAGGFVYANPDRIIFIIFAILIYNDFTRAQMRIRY